MVVPRSAGGVLTTACLLLLPLMTACAPQEETAEEEMAADTSMAGEMEAGAETMAADPFEGEHELSEGRHVEMEDGQYTVYAAGDSVLVEGTYEIRGDTVILVDSSEECADMRGVYTFTVEGGEVATMNVVEDPCEPRRQDIMARDTASRPSM